MNAHEAPLTLRLHGWSRPAGRDAARRELDVVRRLLTPSQYLRYSLIPGALYALARSIRVWNRGEPELKLLPFLVDPHRNAVDVGANKGTYAAHLARCCRHVYAYEPNPAMRWILRRLAPFNVTVLSRALSDRGGEATLQIPCRLGLCSNNTGTLRRTNVAENCETVRVVQSRLDDEGLTDVGFVKIDVEGLEQEVLRGARQLIERDRPILLIEIIAEHTGRPVEETIRFVEELGYRALAIHDGRLSDWNVVRRDRDRLARAGRPLIRLRNFLFLPTDVDGLRSRISNWRPQI